MANSRTVNYLVFGVIPASVFIVGMFSQTLLGYVSVYGLSLVAAVIELVLVAFWLTHEPEFRLLKVSGIIRWGVIAWSFFGLLSVFVAERNSAAAAFAQLQWFLHLLFLLAAFDIFAHNKGACRAFFIAVLVISWVVILNYIYMWNRIPDPRSYNWFHYPVPFPHIRHFGYLCSLAAVIATGFYLWAPRRKFLLLHGFSVVVLVSALFWAGGRASIASYVVGSLLLLVVFYVRQASCMLKVLGLVLSWFLAAIIAMYFDPGHPGMGLSLAHGKEIGEISLNEFSSNRVEIWSRILKEVLEKGQWFGIGADNYRFENFALFGTEQAHSFLFQSLCDWGIVGAVLFVSLFGFVLFSGLKRLLFRSFSDEVLTTVSMASVASYSFLALFDGNLYYPWSVMLIVPALGFLLVTFVDDQHESQKQEDNFSHGYLKTSSAVVFSLCIVAALIQASNVITVLSRSVPSPGGWRANLVMSFPVITVKVDSWLSSWLQDSPQYGVRLLSWLKRYHPEGYKFYLVEAEILSNMGRPEDVPGLVHQAYREAGVYRYDRVTDILIEAGFEEWALDKSDI